MMHYDALSDGAGYLKESKEGRKIMCEAVEKYGDERATVANTNAVRNLILKMNLTIEQALDTLDIQGEERNIIRKQLQK